MIFSNSMLIFAPQHTSKWCVANCLYTLQKLIKKDKIPINIFSQNKHYVAYVYIILFDFVLIKMSFFQPLEKETFTILFNKILITYYSSLFPVYEKFYKLDILVAQKWVNFAHSINCSTHLYGCHRIYSPTVLHSYVQRKIE